MRNRTLINGTSRCLPLRRSALLCSRFDRLLDGLLGDFLLRRIPLGRSLGRRLLSQLSSLAFAWAAVFKVKNCGTKGNRRRVFAWPQSSGHLLRLHTWYVLGRKGMDSCCEFTTASLRVLHEDASRTAILSRGFAQVLLIRLAQAQAAQICAALILRCLALFLSQLIRDLLAASRQYSRCDPSRPSIQRTHCRFNRGYGRRRSPPTSSYSLRGRASLMTEGDNTSKVTALVSSADVQTVPQFISLHGD